MDVKTEIGKLKDDEIAAMGWMKLHLVWLISGCAFVVGLVVGHLI